MDLIPPNSTSYSEVFFKDYLTPEVKYPKSLLIVKSYYFSSGFSHDLTPDRKSGMLTFNAHL